MSERNSERTGVVIGLVVTDALRVAGLQALLGDAGYEVVLLSERIGVEAPVAMVLLDSGATEHLFGLLASFVESSPELPPAGDGPRE